MSKFCVLNAELFQVEGRRAQDDQKAAGEQLQRRADAIEGNVHGFRRRNLEKTYRQPEQEIITKSASSGNTVHKRIKEMESVAEDLFAEWDKEIEEISSETLRKRQAQ